MIIITTPRKIGELGRHLERTGRGSNKEVFIRAGMIRDVPTDPTLALRMMAALARRNRRVKRDIVHVKIAPKLPLNPAALERTLAVFEAEYGIPADVPRHIVEHRKGDRAPHFHVNYAMISPESGKALRFVRSVERDEMIARRLEIELGEGLTPSLRVERVAQLLRERGLGELADIAATGPIAEKGLGRSKAERQQLGRLEANPDLIDARLLQAWRRCDGDIRQLQAVLVKLGFRLAAGDKLVAGVPLVRLIDSETLAATSLTRDLNRVRKASGEMERFRELEIGAAIGSLPSEAEVKAELRLDAPQRSVDALLREFDHLVDEMEFDGEREEAATARKGRDRLAARLSIEEKADLRARQGRVRGRYRQRDRVRRARVNRAFVAAKIFGDRRIRKVAFYLVAVGLLATGAGLITALAAAGVAVATMPSYVGAKRMRAEADQVAAMERAEMTREVQRESQRFFRERTVARRIAEQQRKAREERMRAARAARAQVARAEQARRSQEAVRRARVAELQALARQRAQQAARLAAARGRPDPNGAGQAPRQAIRTRQAPRRGGFER